MSASTSSVPNNTAEYQTLCNEIDGYRSILKPAPVASSSLSAQTVSWDTLIVRRQYKKLAHKILYDIDWSWTISSEEKYDELLPVYQLFLLCKIIAEDFVPNEIIGKIQLVPTPRIEELWKKHAAFSVHYQDMHRVLGLSGNADMKDKILDPSIGNTLKGNKEEEKLKQLQALKEYMTFLCPALKDSIPPTTETVPFGIKSNDSIGIVSTIVESLSETERKSKRDNNHTNIVEVEEAPLKWPNQPFVNETTTHSSSSGTNSRENMSTEELFSDLLRRLDTVQEECDQMKSIRSTGKMSVSVPKQYLNLSIKRGDPESDFLLLSDPKKGFEFSCEASSDLSFWLNLYATKCGATFTDWLEFRYNDKVIETKAFKKVSPNELGMKDGDEIIAVVPMVEFVLNDPLAQHRMEFRMRRDGPMREAFRAFANRFGENMNQLCFKADGECMGYFQSPGDLNLRDGKEVEVKILDPPTKRRRR